MPSARFIAPRSCPGCVRSKQHQTDAPGDTLRRKIAPAGAVDRNPSYCPDFASPGGGDIGGIPASAKLCQGVEARFCRMRPDPRAIAGGNCGSFLDHHEAGLPVSDLLIRARGRSLLPVHDSLRSGGSLRLMKGSCPESDRPVLQLIQDHPSSPAPHRASLQENATTH